MKLIWGLLFFFNLMVVDNATLEVFFFFFLEQRKMKVTDCRKIYCRSSSAHDGNSDEKLYSYSFSVFSKLLLIIAVTHVKGKKVKKTSPLFLMTFLRSTKAWQTSYGRFYQKMPNFWSHALIHQEKNDNKKQLTVWDTPPTVCGVIPTLLNHKYNEKGEARGEKRKEVMRGPRSHQSDWQPWNGTIAGAPPHPGRSLQQPLSKSCIHEIEFKRRNGK